MTFAAVFYRLAQFINGLALLCLSGLVYVWPQQRIFLSQPGLEKFVEVNIASVIAVLFILISSSAAWLFYQRNYLVNRPRRWFHFIVPFLTGGFSGSIVWNSYIFHTTTVEKFNDLELVRNKTWSLVLEPTYSQKIQILNDWYTALQKDQMLLPNWSQLAPLDSMVTQLQHRDYVVSYIYEQSLLCGNAVVPPPVKETWGTWCYNHPYITTAAITVVVVGVALAVLYASQSYSKAKKAAEAAAEDLAEKKATILLEAAREAQIIRDDAAAAAAATTSEAITQAASIVKDADSKSRIIRAIAEAQSKAGLQAAKNRADKIVHDAAADALVGKALLEAQQKVAKVTYQSTALDTIKSWWNPANYIGIKDLANLGTEKVIANVAKQADAWPSIAHDPLIHDFMYKKITDWPGKLAWAYVRMCAYYSHYVVKTADVTGAAGPITPLIMEASAKVASQNVKTVAKWCATTTDLTSSQKYIVGGQIAIDVIKKCKTFVVNCFRFD